MDFASCQPLESRIFRWFLGFGKSVDPWLEHGNNVFVDPLSSLLKEVHFYGIFMSISSVT
jgi:hypothetical protein